MVECGSSHNLARDEGGYCKKICHKNTAYSLEQNDKRDWAVKLWDLMVSKFMCKRSKCTCCEVESVFGYSLKEGVFFVGITSLVMSIMMLFMAAACLVATVTTKKHYNSNPVMASTLIFGLVTCSLSIYQIIISLLLIWQSIMTKGSIFICVLWYVSHISLLTMYFLLFSAEAVVCCYKRYVVSGVITALTGILYEAIFIYFAIVVNSYLHSLNQERYL